MTSGRARAGLVSVGLLVALAAASTGPQAQPTGAAMTNDPVQQPTGGPLPAVDLAAQIAGADLVVVARIGAIGDDAASPRTADTAARPDEDRLRSADLDVLRVLAGRRPDGPLRFRFVAGDVPSRPWPSRADGQVVVLLLRSVDGGMVPVLSTGTTLPALAGTPALTAASAAEAVAHELEEVILAGGSADAPEPIAEALAARLELPGPVDASRVDRVSPPIADRRAAWTAIGVAAGQTEALDRLPSLLRSGDAAGLVQVAVQQVDRDWPPVARPRLVALLWDGPPVVARAAAGALRRMTSPAATGDLVRALDHPDREVRYLAVMGLAARDATGTEVPSFDRFTADETTYTARFRATGSGR